MSSRPFALALLLLAGLTPSLAEAVTVIRFGRIDFDDERVAFLPNGTSLWGSRKTTSMTAAPLAGALVVARWWCTASSQGEVRVNASTDGIWVFAEDLPCSLPWLRLDVRFESHPDGDPTSNPFHAVVAPSELGYFARTPWARPAIGSWVSVNVSCPNQFPNTGQPCTATNAATHEAANIHATVMDVIAVWGAYRGPNDAPLLEIRYPASTAGTNATGNYDRVNLPDQSYVENHRIAHELGHTYMKRAIYDGNRAVGGPSTWVSGHTWNDTRIGVGDPNGLFSSQNGPNDCDINATTFADNCELAPLGDRYPDGNNDGYSETVATSEGWADFFAAATYFEPNANHPYFRHCRTIDGCPSLPAYGAADPSNQELRRLEGETFAHYRYLTSGFEQCVGVGPTNFAVVDRNNNVDINWQHALQGNVARYFWDLYDEDLDANGNGVDDDCPRLVSGVVTPAACERPGVVDNVVFPPSYMLLVWERFRPTYDNRDYDEPRATPSTWDDPDGRNAVDYRKIEAAIPAADIPAEVRGHGQAAGEFSANCLDGQDEG